MKKYRTIDVLVSTFGDRVGNLKNVIKQPRPGVTYIIGHQGADIGTLDILTLEREDVRYFPLDSVGVTKSRNFLLMKSESDICYFCDDDITLDSRFDEVLLNAHNNDSSEVITLKILDENGNPRKKELSTTVTQRNIFNILSVGTIEISLKRECLGNIRFCEFMGAGTSIPIGDEAVFLSDLLKNGHRISYHNIAIASHPIESSGAAPSFDTIFARGMTIRLVYGFFCGLPLALVFIFLRRNLIFKSNFFGGLKMFWSGFFLKNINFLVNKRK
ncbi:glycosyltransferase family 2 protein [Shewanella xiamenensis]|uniref:glycosyltransferase family 2 protein n=1 Tax=Shewanella xiamenensis TaxID=332186 RepID=UPI0035B8659F